ncbi:MAG: hypothetical protein WCL06_09695, partial [Bacteroidota bacterium]
MKKCFSAFVAILICASFSFGQSTDDVVFSFVKKDGEKIMQKKDDGSRFTNFVITGLKTDEQAANFATEFKKSDYVVDFTVSDEFAAGQRNAYLCVRKEAKFEHLRDLLKFNGVTYVKVNGKPTP